MPPATTTLAYLLAAIRIPFGLALFSAPAFTASIFALPPATSSMALLGLRMVGTRDLVVGSLLLRALLHTPTLSNSPVKSSRSDGMEESLLLQPKDHTRKVREGRERKAALVRSALAAGVAIDTLDVCSAVIGYMEESLELQSALTVGIAAMAITDLGVYCLWRGVEEEVEETMS
jgi:hypothetical protein